MSETENAIPVEAAAAEAPVSAPAEAPVVPEAEATTTVADLISEDTTGLAAVAEPTETPDPAIPLDITVREGPCPYVEQDLAKPVFTALKPNTKLHMNDSLAFLGADAEELEARSKNYRTIDLPRNEQTARWALSIQQGQRHQLDHNAFYPNVRDANAEFRQYVVSEGGEKLAAGKPVFGEPSEGGRLAGPQAVMKIRGLLGMGTVARIPLWHTGLWLNYKAPSEIDLLELERRIGEEKIELGRMTSGTIFSNHSVYMNSYLINFCLAHVYEATYKQVPAAELKKLIKVTDLPQLIWGLLCAIYPDGYNYRQPCVIDPTRCTHIVEEKLDLKKISWPNNRAFSEYQRKHMSRRTAKFTDEELSKYEEEHRFVERFGTVELHPGVTMVLQVPTLEEHEQGGFAWVDSMVERADAAFRDKRGNEDERNKMINDMAMATALRTYGQWVKKLVLEDGASVVEDRATIDDTLSSLTAHPGVYEKFFNGIEQFINNCTISLIGIPKIKCPECQEPMSAEELKHPHLLTLDVASIFFTLLDQRVQMVAGSA